MEYFMIRLLLILIFSSAIIPKADAHPVSYKDAVSVMSWSQPEHTHVMTTYTFRWDAALAAQYIRLLTAQGERHLGFGQLNYLIHRWHETDSQANLYVYGGLGQERFLNQSTFAGIAGIEADWESRRWYLSGEFTALLPESRESVYLSKARVGVAPYESGFNELAIWLMLELDHNNRFASREFMLTPLVRFYYRNVLWEVGSAVTGEWMFNFMFHF
jgi:hypothetical protein